MDSALDFREPQLEFILMRRLSHDVKSLVGNLVLAAGALH